MEDQRLRGFIFCSYDLFQPDQLTIELVCTDSNLAVQLMKEAEDKAREMALPILVLYCPDRLKVWYESLGFVHTQTLCLNVHLMKKRI